VKAKVEYVKEVAYTTEQAEENDLQAGKIDIGTVDPGVLTSAAPAPGKVGANWANLASKYNLFDRHDLGLQLRAVQLQ